MNLLRSVLRQAPSSSSRLGFNPAAVATSANLGIRFNVFHPAAPLRFGDFGVEAPVDDDAMDVSSTAFGDSSVLASSMMETDESIANGLFVIDGSQQGAGEFSQTPPHLSDFPDSNRTFPL
jgi:hypothetical protein